MAKIKTLSGAPADFHLPITVKELDGTENEIIFKMKGRTLREWHPVATKRMTEDANNIIAAAEEREAAEAKLKAASESQADAQEDDAPKKLSRIEYDEDAANDVIQKGLGRATEIIMEVASGWDLDDEFSDENLATLCSRYPGVHQQIWEKYNERVRGNRLGN